jgi:hypothetical protein
MRSSRRSFYGIDCGLRDPFGNNLRLTQPAEGPLKVPDPDELAREFSQG